MTAPTPVRSTDQEDAGYVIRIPKLNSDGLKTYALGIAGFFVAMYVAGAYFRGEAVDFAHVMQMFQDLVVSQPVVLLSAILFGQIAAHRKGVKSTEARLSAQIAALQARLDQLLGDKTTPENPTKGTE